MFRPVTITAVLNGWIVTVGCQTVVYQEGGQLLNDLAAYLAEPDATAARVMTSAVNRNHLSGGTPVEGAATGQGYQAVAESIEREVRLRSRRPLEGLLKDGPSNASPSLV